MAERIDEMGFGGMKLIQDTEMFCYGIDAVLLANFALRTPHRNIVDLGTNNGAVPLLLWGMNRFRAQTRHKQGSNALRADAERSPLHSFQITGIEMQQRACLLAQRNIQLNGLEERISICHADILDVKKHFTAGAFDCVVTNPPYMAAGTGIKNEGDWLTAARHETTARLADFIERASWLLADRGYFYMIHRPARIVDISVLCRKHRLEPKYIQFISPHKGEKPNLMLIECRKNGGRELKFLDPIYVYGEDGNYSPEIMKIYGRTDC